MSKWELPKEPKFYDYESPITRIAKEITESMMKEEEDLMFATIKREVGFEVDKDELISALQYDRNQYDKGYKDGAKETFKAELEEIKAEIIGSCNNIAEEVSDLSYTRKIYVYEQLSEIKGAIDRHISEVKDE